jgi:hypothetical protein
MPRNNESFWGFFVFLFGLGALSLVTTGVIIWQTSRQPAAKPISSSAPTLSEIAQVGIDAGIGSCLVSGHMRPKIGLRELNKIKTRARGLMDSLYPEVKGKWPALRDPETINSPEA